MKSIIRFILAFLIFNLTFVREAAALESGDHATPLFVQNFSVATEDNSPRGLTFSNDGTKMFVVGNQLDNSETSGNAGDDIHEYTLSTAFDISTASYVDSLAISGDNSTMSVKFNNDGSKMFVIGTQNDRVYEYSLTANFDLSSATFESFFSVQDDDNTSWGLDFNNDGTMMYVAGGENDSVYQYKLDVGFDLSEGVNLLRTKDASVGLLNPEIEPFGIEFNPDGTTMFIIGTRGNDVLQYALSTGFDVSTISFVGGLHVNLQEGNPSGIAFSPSGLRMFITGTSGDEVNEYHLSCPFNLFSGKCPSITKNKDRTGMAEAQIMIAKRTIDHSTKSALHRLEWIRRNKDNQNLTNLNNFNTAIISDNPLLNYWVKKFPDKLVAVNEAVEGGRSITIGREYKKGNKNSNNLDNFNTAIKSDNPLLNSWMNKLPEEITAHNASLKEKSSKDKKSNWSYWSEGTISIGKIGDSLSSSAKNINTTAITIGADRRADNGSMFGLALRFGNDDIDFGNVKNSLDVDTVSLTLYGSRLLGEDKFIDSLIGIGSFKTDIVNAVGSSSTKGTRDGKQIFSSFKIRETFKKNKLNFTPNIKLDLGFTSLSDYSENGSTNLKFDRQNIGTIITSIGGTLDNIIDLNGGTLKPFIEMDYYADISPSSEQKI